MKTNTFAFQLSVPVAAAACLLLQPAGAFADERVPFKGDFDPNILQVTPLDDSHVHLDLNVIARASHLGNAQGSASITLNTLDFTYVGHTTWVAANGDEVSFTFEGQFVATTTSGVLQNVETFEIVGGTGRFNGAIGVGAAAGLVDAATLAPLGGTVPFVGTISSPGDLNHPGAK